MTSPSTYLFYAVVSTLLLIAVIALIKGIRRIMSAIDDLKAANADLNAKADALIAFAGTQVTAIAALNARILGLEQQINAGGADEQTLRALIDDMRAETSKMAAAIPAGVGDATPAPTAPPTT